MSDIARWKQQAEEALSGQMPDCRCSWCDLGRALRAAAVEYEGQRQRADEAEADALAFKAQRDRAEARTDRREARVDALKEALYRVTVQLELYVGPRHPTAQAGRAALSEKGDADE